jgi:type II secretory pathway pseudopilin PulG
MHALILALACLQDPLTEDIDKALGNLYSDRHAESELAKQELIEIGRRSVPKLLAELGKQREPEGKDATDKKRKQVRVRRLICEVLGRVRDNSQPVLDALVARLTDMDEYGLSVAAAAAGALGSIADERTAGALVTALTSKQAETDKWLKYYCIHALGVMRASQAGEALKKALEDESAAQVAGEDAHLIAAAACDALRRVRVKDAVDGLGKLLDSSKVDPFSQQQLGVHAARALEKILGESRGPLEGDAVTLNGSLAAWRTWWGAEQGKKNIAETKSRLADLTAAVEAFKRDTGNYPAILAHLSEKPADFKGTWPEGGYYKGKGYETTTKQVKDAWNRPFYFRVGAEAKYGNPYDIYSYGKNGALWGKGDDADLWNHDKWQPVKAEENKKAHEAVAAAIKKFNEDQGVLPSSLSVLVGDKPPPNFATKKEWPKEGYWKGKFDDAFGFAFDYRKGGTGGEAFDLISWGADNQPGGIGEFADLWNHDKWKQPRVDDTKKKLEQLGKAVETFKKEQERWPDKLEDLRTKPTWAKKWPDRGYWKDTTQADPTTDAFGNALVFRGGDKVEIVSLGADGREGGSGLDEDLSWKSK